MTNFLDVRALSGGGGLSDKVQLKTTTPQGGYVDLDPNDFASFIYGQNVLIATHGFNVNRSDGIEHLSYWQTLLTLPDNSVFLGLLWPGDSESLYALSYPAEPKNAMGAGDMIADFVNSNFGNAASVSFASHSLGARVILQAIHGINRRVRRAILMAGAIGDNCLTAEYADVPTRVDVISALASKEDDVLRWAFPIGDFAAEILDHTHPWWESALGRFGPTPIPAHFQPPDQIPNSWNYGHGNYLQDKPQAVDGPIPPQTDVPQEGDPPQGGADGWQEAFSASFVSTRFR
jgi:pimeloyl-ACP methyl ester carboxylesterase